MYCPFMSMRKQYTGFVDCNPDCMMFDREHEDCLIALAARKQINPLSMITTNTFSIEKTMKGDHSDEILRNW